MKGQFRKRFGELLEYADVRIDGDRPWDLQVNREEVFARMFASGSLGLGESYVDGWWDCDRLDELMCRLSGAELKSRFRAGDIIHVLHSLLVTIPYRRSDPDAEGKVHYEQKRELYRCMLDKRMIYSCAFWENAKSLDEAQEHKLDLIARKLRLKPGMKILDIGCGWGGALHYLAEKYGVSGVAVTISPDQFAAASELYAGLPLEVRLQDYRAVSEQFDHSFSIDMLGHVGRRNYRKYLRTVRRQLHPGGLHLVQTAGSANRSVKADPWVNRYIFPGSHIPSPKQIAEASEGVLVLQDWHNFTQDYDRTFMCWYENLSAAWEALGYDNDDRLFRMWRYYLLSFAGVFRSGVSQLWQITFSRDGASPGNIR
ncbi:MAG: cyclopropane fatty acyl phospholipid synthase [Rhodobacteraceae bacterium]|nr:cyclopropane fatty acyl phospholipid synthase [Paracoccaceae bacterium]